MDESPKERHAKKDLTSGPILRTLLNLSMPIAAGTVLQALYSLIDAFWLGRLSKQALAAPGVTGSFIWLVVSFGMGFGGAGTALVAQYIGAKRYREADNTAGQVFTLMVAWTAAIALPLFALAPVILRAFQVPADVVPMATTYLRIIALGMPLMGFTIAYGSILRALGDTMTVVLIGAASNIVNLVVDPVLIFGWYGAPAMGVAGAAVATVISQGLQVIACYVLLRRRHAGLHIRREDYRPNWSILKKVWSVGVPTALANSSGSLGFIIFQVMINTLGTTVIGAYTIGFRLIHFFQVPGQALGMAAAPIVGQALGAGKPALARRAIMISAVIVAAGTLVPMVLLMTEGHLVARLFTHEPDVIAETGRFFQIVPASSYLFGVIMVLSAAFYGSGHTRPAMILTILRMWVLRLPVAYFLGFTLGWGSMGVYGGMVVGNVISAVATYQVFRMGRWERAVISPARAPAVETAEDALDAAQPGEAPAGD